MANDFQQTAVENLRKALFENKEALNRISLKNTLERIKKGRFSYNNTPHGISQDKNS